MSDVKLKFGHRVPDGAVNLAWIAPPPLTPENNVFVSDVAATISANSFLLYDTTLSSAVTATTFILDSYDDSTRIKSGERDIVSIHVPIEVKSVVEDETGAWYLQVTDGLVQQRVVLDVIELDQDSSSWLKLAADDAGWEEGDELVAVYSLQDVLFAMADYAVYQFSSSVNYTAKAGYKENVECVILNNKEIKIPHDYVYRIYSLTINGTKTVTQSDFAHSNSRDPLIIESVDWANGIVRLKNALPLSSSVQATFTHRITEYTYRGYYDEDAGVYQDLDLNPSYGHTYGRGTSGSSLLSSVVYIYLLPAAAYRLSDANTSGQVRIFRAVDYGVNHLLRWESGPAIAVPKEDDSLARGWDINVYGAALYDESMFSDRLPTDFPGVGDVSSPVGTQLLAGGTGTLKNYPSALVLAKIYTASAGNISSVKVVDTRTRGGGLGDDFVERKAKLVGEPAIEAEACWDVSGWDGTPVMLNGVVVFDMPKSLLVSEGGGFTEREIEAIVSKHITAGVLPIIRYVD